MSKKILIINNSNGKRNTCHLLKQVGSILEMHGMEYEVLNHFDCEK